MFWSSPSADLKIVIWLSFFAFAVSVGIYVFGKKALPSIIALSILENIIFYLNSGSRMFSVYKINWVVVFALDFWPYINIALMVILIINFIKNKHAKTKNK